MVDREPAPPAGALENDQLAPEQPYGTPPELVPEGSAALSEIFGVVHPPTSISALLTPAPLLPSCGTHTASVTDSRSTVRSTTAGADRDSAGARLSTTAVPAGPSTVAASSSGVPTDPRVPLSPLRTTPPVTPPLPAPQAGGSSAGSSAGGTGQGKDVDGKLAVLVSEPWLPVPQAAVHSTRGPAGCPVMRPDGPEDRPD
ncbi:hypothetical protein [Geodermatophilus sp. CPCC 205761]|uniref:hypothetical protein n=1 Tax=Geodermatophilus sp. CPCC 205761 TaxID=2936597 RepID=UPI003EEB4ABF